MKAATSSKQNVSVLIFGSYQTKPCCQAVAQSIRGYSDNASTDISIIEALKAAFQLLYHNR
ncbi:hypothetical protein EON65_48625 [archaeon]|nr:MAG: hypothetical protein EON65_48625 [archaeon]